MTDELDYIEDPKINHDISESLEIRLGQKIGHWRVVSGETQRFRGINHRQCLCSCGFEAAVAEASLKNGRSLSCGCARYEKRKRDIAA